MRGKPSIRCMVVLVGMLAASCSPYVEYNPITSVPVDFMASANKLVFGVSTGLEDENSVTVQGSSVTLKARNDTNNAGKIAGSEDGITYYFKEVDADKNFKLYATFQVVFFGGRDVDGVTVTSNGQEGFGLMARDYVPQYPGFQMDTVKDNGVYWERPTDPATGDSYSTIPGGCSNMVMVGGVKRGVRMAVRRGVSGSEECITDPNVLAAGGKSIFEYQPTELADYSMYPTLDSRPEFPSDGSVYKLSLVKTNNGFTATIIPPASKGVAQEYSIPYPDVLTSIKKDKYYVGLFASRSAEVIATDISYFESDASQDPPPLPASPEILTPRFSITSPDTASETDYRLYCSANVKGWISVLQGGAVIPGVEHVEGVWYSVDTMPAEAAIMADACTWEIPVLPLKDGENVFTVYFYPDTGQILSSNATIKKVFLVSKKTFFDPYTPMYVSPAGRSYNAGTAASPLDLQTAISYVQPGQKIIMLDGAYIVESVRIPRYNTGSYGAYKQLVAEHRDQVFLDFNKDPDATGFVLGGDYWRLDGFHVRNTPDKVKGLTIGGHNNIVEWVKTYGNGDTGLQISGSSTESRTWWPSYNIISYCESYDNLDAAMNDADGFAAKLTVGDGNEFRWCVSHNNCDDGWDLFTKKESDYIGAVKVDSCIAYRNGTMMDGYQTNSGRNGFKLGGEGVGVMHTVVNCLAFQNGAHGFTSNSNPDIQLTNCTSFDNGVPAWNSSTSDSRNFTIYNGSGLINAISMKRKLDGILSLYTDGTGRSEDKVILKAGDRSYAWIGSMTGSTTGTSTRNVDGTILVDTPTGAHPLSAVVVSVIPPLDAQGFISRDTQGRFILNGFAALSSPPADNPGADFIY